MPIDATIPLGVRAPQIMSTFEAQESALRMQALNDQSQDAERSRADNITLRELYRRSVNPTTGAVDRRTLFAGMADAGMGDRITDVSAKMAESDKSLAEADKLQWDQKMRQHDVAGSILAGALSNPDGLSDGALISTLNQYVKEGLLHPEQARTMLDAIPGPGPARRAWALQAAVQNEAGRKALEAQRQVAPTNRDVDLGDRRVTMQRDPLTGAERVVRTDQIGVSPTTVFSSRAADARQARADDRADARELRRASLGTLAPEAIELAAQRLLMGEQPKDVLANFGRGAQGAANIAAVQNRFAKLAADLGVAPRDVASRVTAMRGLASAAVAAGRVQGVREGRVIEAEKFAEIAQRASDAVPRGVWRGGNWASQLAQAQVSDPRLAAFRAANTSLVNAYTAAVTSTGASTEGARQHAYAMLNTADGPEAYRAVVAQILVETRAALEASKAAQNEIRGQVRDLGAPPAAATPSPTSADGWSIEPAR